MLNLIGITPEQSRKAQSTSFTELSYFSYNCNVIHRLLGTEGVFKQINEQKPLGKGPKDFKLRIYGL